MNRNFLAYLAATGAVLVAVLLTVSSVGSQIGINDDDGPPASPPAAPPGVTPGPYYEPSPAPPLPDDAPQTCPTVVDLRGSVPPLDTKQDLDNYVEQQRTLLDNTAEADPARALRAGVNLKRLLDAAELDSLLEAYELKWNNIYWQALSGEPHGAMSSAVGPQTLTDLKAELTANGELPAGGDVAMYYFTTAETELGTLSALAKEADVLLVDVGPIDQLDAAQAPEGCVRFALPDPLWYEYKRLDPTAISE